MTWLMLFFHTMGDNDMLLGGRAFADDDLPLFKKSHAIVKRVRTDFKSRPARDVREKFWASLILCQVSIGEFTERRWSDRSIQHPLPCSVSVPDEKSRHTNRSILVWIVAQDIGDRLVTL
jgi:hypothetical protein